MPESTFDADLERLRVALNQRVEQFAARLRAQTSAFAKEKLAEVTEKIIDAKELSRERYLASVAHAETYRATSPFLADATIEAAGSQYRSAVEMYDKLLTWFEESIQDQL